MGPQAALFGQRYGPCSGAVWRLRVLADCGAPLDETQSIDAARGLALRKAWLM